MARIFGHLPMVALVSIPDGLTFRFIVIPVGYTSTSRKQILVAQPTALIADLPGRWMKFHELLNA